MDTDCLFCRIIAGELPSDEVGSNDVAIAFRDINPRAPIHDLVVSRRHVGSAHDLDQGDGDELAGIFSLIREVAVAEGIAEGYRVVTNIGPLGGQVIFHLHFHVLGGTQQGPVGRDEPKA